jgi:amino acid transporter
METVRTEQPPAAARLGLWDTTSIIVGIIIGVGIFKTPASIFRDAGGPWLAVGLWLVGGLVSLVGALCFAELASTYPRSGGEYVYLTRAFGRPMGFLFAWTQLVVIRTAGSVSVVAFLFAQFAVQLLPPDASAFPFLQPALGALAIAVLTVVNLVGVRSGKWTQNVLTTLKVLGIGGILAAGFFFSPGGPEPGAAARGGASSGGTLAAVGAALIAVFWTYAGWQEAGYVTAEVRDRRRNVPRALILGTAVVTAIYLLVNLACLAGLGFEAAGRSRTVAADVLALALGKQGAWAMSLLVVISALGALNGMIFTSSRIFAEFGADHRLFAPLGRWHRRWRTPTWSLLLQGALSGGVVLAVGLLPAGKDGFEQLMNGTAAVFWLFFLLTGAALFVLRFREPHIERPFRVPGYPVLPLVFCAFCAVMIGASVGAAPGWNALGFAVVLAGLPLYALSRRLGGPRPAGPPAAPAESRKTAAPV